jgi:hypothetical protein
MSTEAPPPMQLPYATTVSYCHWLKVWLSKIQWQGHPPSHLYPSFPLFSFCPSKYIQSETILQQNSLHGSVQCTVNSSLLTIPQYSMIIRHNCPIPLHIIHLVSKPRPQRMVFFYPAVDTLRCIIQISVIIQRLSKKCCCKVFWSTEKTSNDTRHIVSYKVFWL